MVRIVKNNKEENNMASFVIEGGHKLSGKFILSTRKRGPRLFVRAYLPKVPLR